MADNNNAAPTVPYLRQAKMDLEQNLLTLLRDEIKMFTDATGVQVQDLSAWFSKVDATTLADAQPASVHVLNRISVELDI